MNESINQEQETNECSHRGPCVFREAMLSQVLGIAMLPGCFIAEKQDLDRLG